MIKITWEEAIKSTINDWMIKLLFLLSIISTIIGIFSDNPFEHFAPLIASIIVFVMHAYIYKHMPLDNPESRKIVEYNKRRELEALVLGQIDKGEKMSEEVLKKLVETFAVSEVQGDCHKWTQTIMTIIKIQKHSFIITWQKGLYSDADTRYDFQPIKIK